MKINHSKLHILYLGVFSFFAIFTSTSVWAQETNVIVRAKAKDAKFIGSSIGGAFVIIKEHLTGKILAEGLTEGTTGNTETIIQSPIIRGQNLANDNTAAFKASLDIDKPTFVTIEVYGPVASRQAAVLSSTQLWLIPGEDIIGDGLIIEVPGFIVDILSPQTHETIGIKSKGVMIRANIVLMCGCPITKGGLWDSDKYEIAANIYKNGEKFKTVPLQAQEKASTFSTEIMLDEGNYQVEVYAIDPETGNTGLDKVNFKVR
jgi:hypothetical protein